MATRPLRPFSCSQPLILDQGGQGEFKCSGASNEHTDWGAGAGEPGLDPTHCRGGNPNCSRKVLLPHAGAKPGGRDTGPSPGLCPTLLHGGRERLASWDQLHGASLTARK